MPTNPIPTGVITYRAYRNGTNISSGMVDVKLPDLAFVTQEVSGPGVLGTVDAVLPLLQAMTATLKWRTVDEQQAQLMDTLQQQGLIFRVAQELYDGGAGGAVVKPLQVNMKAAVKRLSLGTLAQAAATDSEIELAVNYLKVSLDGVTIFEADPYAEKLVINGRDALASVRAAL